MRKVYLAYKVKVKRVPAEPQAKPKEVITERLYGFILPCASMRFHSNNSKFKEI